MVTVNQNLAGLFGNYLFAEVAHRVSVYKRELPAVRVISLGIGDVTLPITPAVTKAMVQAVAELGTAEGFRGYGPEGGYPFLREAIAEHDYAARSAPISPDEIFISDGAKSDCGDFLDLFGMGNAVAFADPAYPAYGEACAMSGREMVRLPCTVEDGFVPQANDCKANLLYLCFPNNPTGAMATRAQLRQWVDWGNDTGGVILYDSAYEAFIADETLPHSIFELNGAERCCVEFRSFSKTAGFTGLRCGYTVVPKALKRDGCAIRDLWMRRQAARFNGVSYVTQRGAAAAYTAEGMAQGKAQIDVYRDNAAFLQTSLERLGYAVYGGVHAPYLWVKTKGGERSWDFFERCLRGANVVVTPGAGFGERGEGYFRVTAFGDAGETADAAARLARLG